jgi:hypothetical protein
LRVKSRVNFGNDMPDAMAHDVGDYVNLCQRQNYQRHTESASDAVIDDALIARVVAALSRLFL